MPKAAARSITIPTEQCPFPPLANGADFGGYNFVTRRYTIELRKDGQYIDKVEVDRDEAVRLALQILDAQTLVASHLTREEATAVERIAAAR